MWGQHIKFCNETMKTKRVNVETSDCGLNYIRLYEVRIILNSGGKVSNFYLSEKKAKENASFERTLSHVLTAYVTEEFVWC